MSDEERFAVLFRRYQPAVRRYALNRLTPGEADDLVAQTFLTVWRRLERVPEDPLPWLYGVARHALLDIYREQQRQDRVADKLSRTVATPAAATDSDAVLHIHEALVALSEPDREILRLSAWEDLRPADIARALGCSPANASLRLHRARRRLAKALAATPPRQTEPLRTGVTP